MPYYKPTTSGGGDAVKEESLRVSSIKLTFPSALQARQWSGVWTKWGHDCH